MSILNSQNFSDVELQLDNLPEANFMAGGEAQAREDQLTKPQGSLGRLEEFAVFMATWQGVVKPSINQAQCLIFAGNHGVVARGVSLFPQEVTEQMVANFAHGGAAINQLCQANGADLEVIPIALDEPTKDISQGPAMTEAETMEAILIGANAVDANADIVLLGEMGIGNSTIAAALSRAVFDGEGQDWAGPGTGLDAAGVSLKAQIVNQAIEANQDALGSGLGILAALGGREQAAICGAILRARELSIPVMLDGYIVTASAAPLYKYEGALDHCLVGHRSAEPGHGKILTAMGKTPILDLEMRLGEGSGAATALGIVRSALSCHNGMATFAEAGVSGSE